MKETAQVALDFYHETDKENPFHIHRSSNAASQALVHLRNHAYILNKLSLLPANNPTSSNQQHIELYAAAIESIANNPQMPFRCFAAVKDLVYHLERYYSMLLLKWPNSSASAQWPRIRAAFMTIEDKIPKASTQWIRDFVIIRRGLLEPDKNYFLNQMLAKKVDTRELLNLISHFKGDISAQELAQQPQIQNEEALSFETIKNRVRMIALSDKDEDWRLLQALQKNSLKCLSVQEKRELDEFCEDILDSYKMKREFKGSEVDKIRANSVRGRVLAHYLNYEGEESR